MTQPTAVQLRELSTRFTKDELNNIAYALRNYIAMGGNKLHTGPYRTAWVEEWANRISLAASEPAPEPQGGGDNAAALIVRDVCELDPADPANPHTVSVRVSDLLRIAQRHALTPKPSIPQAESVPVVGGEWALVPVKPTEAMLDFMAGDEECEAQESYRLLLEAAPTRPAPQADGEGDDLARVYDLFRIGSQSRTIDVLLANIGNVKRFSDMLWAVEREFFTVPGKPDEDYPDDEPQPECLLNCFGSTVEEYVEQFRAALSTEDLGSLREQAMAWEAVYAVLHEVAPGWNVSPVATTAVELAVSAIRTLAASKAPAEVTGEMVERAAEALWAWNESHMRGVSWKTCLARDDYRNKARAALTAALRPTSTTRADGKKG